MPRRIKQYQDDLKWKVDVQRKTHPYIFFVLQFLQWEKDVWMDNFTVYHATCMSLCVRIARAAICFSHIVRVVEVLVFLAGKSCLVGR